MRKVNRRSTSARAAPAMRVPMPAASSARRSRVERGIYRQANGKYAVCARRAGRLHFRTAGRDLEAARGARAELIAALAAGRVRPHRGCASTPSPLLERFEAKVAAGERHPRTLEAHRYQLEQNLLPTLASRRIASLDVDDVAALLTALREAAARRSQRPTPLPPCTASFATPVATTGSAATRSSARARRAPATTSPPPAGARTG